MQTLPRGGKTTMTLWFDVSDLYLQKRFSLTGIYRTVVFLLDGLCRRGMDVRLFRYDAANGLIYEAFPAQLPAAVQKYIPTTLRVIQNPEPLARGREPGRERASASGWLRAHTPARVKIIVRPILNSLAKVRRTAPRIKPSPRRLRGEAAHHRQTPFATGDICFSASATWSLAGYGEAIAHAKRTKALTCINLVYDLIPTLYPQWVSEQYAREFTSWVRGQIRNADVLLAISEFQRKEIAAYIAGSKLPPKPIAVVRLGDDDLSGRSACNRAPLPRYVPREPFVLCVSHLDIRKNHYCLYQVWKRLASSLGTACPRLLLVGHPAAFTHDLIHQMTHDPAVRRLITWLQRIPDHELHWYYENCLFTIYPSLYEGWGLPIAESLRHAKLCIASNTTSMPEVGGELVDYFDPADIDRCFALTMRAIEDRDYVKEREREIERNYKPTPWTSTVTQIAELIDRLPSGPSKAKSDENAAPLAQLS